MKLLTHNMLSSKCIKGVNLGYPLEIVARDVKISEVDFNSEFIARILPKLHYSTLYGAAETLGEANGLPKEIVDNYENNEEFLRKVHHVLLEVEVIDGDLVCPETGRKFPINLGIPNMLLNEDEV